MNYFILSFPNRLKNKLQTDTLLTIMGAKSTSLNRQENKDPALTVRQKFTKVNQYWTAHMILLLIRTFANALLLKLFAYWVIFHAFLSPADFFFQNQHFRKTSFRNIIRVSNSLDPDQAQRYIGSDLGLTCLQRLSADDTSR